jgi:sulfoxide reductase heme-binding subunit YedZ
MAPGATWRRAGWLLAWLLCALPAADLVLATAGLPGRGLGANPVEALIHETGSWALRLLLATLLVTPLAALWPALELPRLRRMLGLWAFTYALAHFLIYLVVDQGLAWSFIAEDIAKRPYITLGFTALVLLVPLAATSTRRAMRRLGRRWQRLHRLVYPVALLGCWHFYWLVKADVREPLVCLAVWILAMLWRAWRGRGVQRATADAGGRTRASPAS